MLEPDVPNLDVMLLKELADVFLAKPHRIISDVDLVLRPKSYKN